MGTKYDPSVRTILHSLCISISNTINIKGKKMQATSTVLLYICRIYTTIMTSLQIIMNILHSFTTWRFPSERRTNNGKNINSHKKCMRKKRAEKEKRVYEVEKMACYIIFITPAIHLWFCNQHICTLSIFIICLQYTRFHYCLLLRRRRRRHRQHHYYHHCCNRHWQPPRYHRHHRSFLLLNI